MFCLAWMTAGSSKCTLLGAKVPSGHHSRFTEFSAASMTGPMKSCFPNTQIQPPEVTRAASKTLRADLPPTAIMQERLGHAEARSGFKL